MSLEFCKFSFTMLTTGTLCSSRRISTYLKYYSLQILTLKKLQGEQQVSLRHFKLSESLCVSELYCLCCSCSLSAAECGMGMTAC